MHIGIDCRFAATPTGLGRYTRELVSQLVALPGEETYSLFVRNAGETWLGSLPKGSWRFHQVDIPYYSLAEQLRFPRDIREVGVHLLFSPHFNVPLRCPVPFVVTIHDLILHRYPNNSPMFKRVAYRFLMRNAVSHARRIIAVSAFTASELSAVYGASVSGKTVIVREGVGPEFTPQSADTVERTCRKYGLPEEFFLYVGNAKEHKNVPLLLQAFSRTEDRRMSLVLVTGGREASTLTLPERTLRLDHIADGDLPALYSAARAFVTASLYEGYCLPVAEALACGCPIVATRAGAIPELAEGNALLVEPTVEALAKALHHLPDRPVRRPLQSWEKSAESVQDILRGALR